MPRLARGLVNGYPCLVSNLGRDGEKIFRDDEDYQSFVALLKEAKERHPVRVLAYCLMPDHFHLLLLSERAKDMSKWMHWLMASHAWRFRGRYGTCGRIWEGRFRSFIVQEGEHLLQVAVFIEGSPVREGLAGSAAAWQWSSHGERTGRCPLQACDALPGEVPSDWGEYVAAPLAQEEYEKVCRSMKRQAPYGDAAWREAVCRRHGLESTMRALGRPRKESEITCPHF